MVLLLLVAFASSAWLSRPVVQGELGAETFAGMGLAPPDDAITLARTLDGEVLLVTAVGEDGVVAVDLGAAGGHSYEDAVDAYTRLGAAGLRALAAESSENYRWDELGLPLTPRFPHIAAGTNYRAHARESGRDSEEPFLFPKLSTSTPWNRPARAE